MSSASAEPRRRLPLYASSSSSSSFSGRQEQSRVSAAHFFRAKSRHRPNPSLPDLSVGTTSRREEIPKKKTKSNAEEDEDKTDGGPSREKREETNEYGEATFNAPGGWFLRRCFIPNGHLSVKRRSGKKDDQ